MSTVHASALQFAESSVPSWTSCATDRGQTPCIPRACAGDSEQGAITASHKRRWRIAGDGTGSLTMQLQQTGTVSAKTSAKRNAGLISAALTYDHLRTLFHLPVAEAAQEVGVGRTLFKKICRREGIQGWPLRERRRDGRVRAGGNYYPHALPAESTRRTATDGVVALRVDKFLKIGESIRFSERFEGVRTPDVAFNQHFQEDPAKHRKRDISEWIFHADRRLKPNLMLTRSLSTPQPRKLTLDSGAMKSRSGSDDMVALPYSQSHASVWKPSWQLGPVPPLVSRHESGYVDAGSETSSSFPANDPKRAQRCYMSRSLNLNAAATESVSLSTVPPRFLNQPMAQLHGPTAAQQSPLRPSQHFAQELVMPRHDKFESPSDAWPTPRSTADEDEDNVILPLGETSRKRHRTFSQVRDQVYEASMRAAVVDVTSNPSMEKQRLACGNAPRPRTVEDEMASALLGLEWATQPKLGQ